MFNRTLGDPDVGALTESQVDAELERLKRLEARWEVEESRALAGEPARGDGIPDLEPADRAEDQALADEPAHGDGIQDLEPAGLASDQAPPSFLDPISRELMRDPVMVVECGQVYERTSIEEWFAKQPDGAIPNDPLTAVPLASVEVRPVHALRNAIEEWIAMQAAGNQTAVSAPTGIGVDDRAREQNSSAQSVANQRLQQRVDSPAERPEFPRAITPSLPAFSHASTSKRVTPNRHHAQDHQQRIVRAQRAAQQRRTGSAIYRFGAVAGRTAVSQRSIGLTLVTIVASLFMCMVEYTNQKYPGAGASDWVESWDCELRSARVECQQFGKDATGGFTIDSDRERCRTAFTIARRRSDSSVEDETRPMVQLQAYRYPTAIFIDTAAESEAFLNEVIGAANERVGGAPGSSAWVNSSVPCRCGTLLETQRCGHCECGQHCVGERCQCVCPTPQESGGHPDFACGCVAPKNESWSPCQDGHCQLGVSGTPDAGWDVVYETGLTGTARVGLLICSIGLVWAGFSCCAYSATLLERRAAAQLAVALAAMAQGEEDRRNQETSQENEGTFRADLAAAVTNTSSTEDVQLVVVAGATSGDTFADKGTFERPDREYNASSCCCCSGLAYTVGIAGIACAQAGGGRLDWFGYGFAIAFGFVAMSMVLLRLAWRQSA